jgi:E3 ubiquitin-protein ligase RNF115/126
MAPQAPDGRPGPPNGIPTDITEFFHNMLNPANAVSGDAVYSQEALDRIISSLMEQAGPVSTAPGPATTEAIDALPKIHLTKEMLGAELKAECSVCMEDVFLGDEVVSLPCTHWFHQTCATAWLSEHNTCPICRKSIDVEVGDGAAKDGGHESGMPSDLNRSLPASEVQERHRRAYAGQGAMSDGATYGQAYMAALPGSFGGDEHDDADGANPGAAGEDSVRGGGHAEETGSFRGWLRRMASGEDRRGQSREHWSDREG